MKELIIEKGPLITLINQKYFEYYTSGIMKYNYLQCSPDDVDHAAVIIGWGEEIVESTGELVLFWILMNAWADDWGEEVNRKYEGKKNLFFFSFIFVFGLVFVN